MDDIRKDRDIIYANTSEYLNNLSNLFQRPMKYDIGIWTKDDIETPIKGKNCIVLKVYW